MMAAMHQPAGRSNDSGRGCLVALATMFVLGLTCFAAPALVRAVQERIPRPPEQEVVIWVEANAIWYDRSGPVPDELHGPCNEMKVSITKRGQTAAPLAEGTTDGAGRVFLRVPAGRYQIVAGGRSTGRCAGWFEGYVHTEELVVGKGQPTVVRVTLGDDFGPP